MTRGINPAWSPEELSAIKARGSAARWNPDGTLTLADRFWSKVDKSGPNGCWVWTASCHPHGHGQFSLHGVPVKSHRLSYEWANGPIPPDRGVLHHCDNPPCVNPDHLYLGTQADNDRDMAVRRRGTARRGRVT
jgi:hypothetical protein